MGRQSARQSQNDGGDVSIAGERVRIEIPMGPVRGIGEVDPRDPFGNSQSGVGFDVGVGKGEVTIGADGLAIGGEVGIGGGKSKGGKSGATGGGQKDALNPSGGIDLRKNSGIDLRKSGGGVQNASSPGLTVSAGLKISPGALTGNGGSVTLEAGVNSPFGSAKAETEISTDGCTITTTITVLGVSYSHTYNNPKCDEKDPSPSPSPSPSPNPSHPYNQPAGWYYWGAKGSAIPSGPKGDDGPLLDYGTVALGSLGTTGAILNEFNGFWCQEIIYVSQGNPYPDKAVDGYFPGGAYVVEVINENGTIRKNWSGVQGMKQVTFGEIQYYWSNSAQTLLPRFVPEQTSGGEVLSVTACSALNNYLDLAVISIRDGKNYGTYYKDNSINHSNTKFPFDGPLATRSRRPSPSYNPPPMEEKECCNASLSLLRKVAKVLDVEKLDKEGFFIPNRMMMAQSSGQTQVKTYTDIVSMFLRIMAHSMIFEPELDIKDASSQQAGNQALQMKFVNATAWAKAMGEMIYEIMDDGNASTNIELRTGITVTQTLVAVVDCVRKLDATLDALGVQLNHRREIVETAFDLSCGEKGFDGSGKVKTLDKLSDEETESLLPLMLNSRKNPLKTVVVHPKADSIVEMLEDIQRLLQSRGAE